MTNLKSEGKIKNLQVNNQAPSLNYLENEDIELSDDRLTHIAGGNANLNASVMGITQSANTANGGRGAGGGG